jgi:protein O-mannosyl-transferase
MNEPMVQRDLIPGLTTRRVAWICALVACLVYAHSLRNGWALDDEDIIKENAVVHSVDSAVASRFSPYWPERLGFSAGQYRPLTILSFSVDWWLSGGKAWLFHAENAVLHGVACALFVLVVVKWLPPVGALAAGLIFAIHPVHVEAVANVVGRAEVLTAVFLLGALLAARRFRRSIGPWPRRGWLLATVLLVLCGLFTKEHAVVAVALLAVDEFVDPDRNFRRSTTLYAAIGAVTLAWLYLWVGVAGQFVDSSEAAGLRGLSSFQRLATVFPVQLHVLRLLVWPFDLAPDYNPQVIPRRTSWSIVATIGLVTSLALLLLAWKLRHRTPAFTAGILGSVIAYAPTSNLLFASGIALAERNLYLSVWAPAVTMGCLVANPVSVRARRWASLALLLIIGMLTAKTITRVPDWKSTDSILIDDFVDHGENYRSHLRIGSMLFTSGDTAGALAQAMVAGALFPQDPYVTLVTAPLAQSLGYSGLAVREAERGYEMGRTHQSLIRSVVRTRLATGNIDSALTTARTAVQFAPNDPVAASIYQEVLGTMGAPSWRRALASAHHQFLERRLGEATRMLASGIDGLPVAASDSGGCWDVEQSIPLIDRLQPRLLMRARRFLSSGACTRPK